MIGGRVRRAFRPDVRTDGEPMHPDANGGIPPPIAPPGEPVHWLVRPRTIRGLWIGFAVILTALVLGDLLVHGHPGFGVDGTFGFYAWYGLGTCVAMVLVAKALGLVLKRPDTYYDPRREGGPPEEGASVREAAGGEEDPAARRGGPGIASPAGRRGKPAAMGAARAMEAAAAATEAVAADVAGAGGATGAAGERKTVEEAAREASAVAAGPAADAAEAAEAAETKGRSAPGG